MDNIFIKRQIFDDLKSHLEKKEISLIIGPRQVGKTTTMLALKSYLESMGKKTLYLSMDFENDQDFFSAQEKMIKKLSLEFGQNKGYVFLDEVQRKEDAGLFLKGLYDKSLPHKFIISGSGSVELKERVHESLAGRKLLFEIEPISLFEFINFKTNYQYENKLEDFFSLEQKKLAGYLEDYLNFGGYPRVILEDALVMKKRIIDEIYRSYIERDISYWLKIEKTEAFSSLLKILAGQNGGILNYSKISNSLDISLPTVKKYLWYLEKTYIIKKLNPFFRNIKKEITKSPTIYFHDLGLRNYLFGNFGAIKTAADMGFLFQNLILNLLTFKLNFTNWKINFWRTKEKAEVDFVINSPQEIIPIEVKYTNFKSPIAERSLRSFIEKYEPKKAIVVNRNLNDKLILNQTTIYFITIEKLLNFSLN